MDGANAGVVKYRGLLLSSAEPCSALDAEEHKNKDPTYLQLWRSATDALCDLFSVALADLLRRTPRALELGSGLGAAGLHAANLGCPRVCLTDYSALALAQLRANIDRNGLSASVSVAELDWSSRRDPAAPRWPLLFGADLCVSERNASLVAATVRSLLQQPHGLFIYAHQPRRALYRAPSGVRRERCDTALETLQAALCASDASWPRGLRWRELAVPRRATTSRKKRGASESEREPPAVLLAFGSAEALAGLPNT